MYVTLSGATKHLYNWLCPLVGWSVGWSVGKAFISQSTPSHLLTYLALFVSSTLLFVNLCTTYVYNHLPSIIYTQGKTLFVSLLVQPLQSSLLNLSSSAFYLNNVYFTTGKLHMITTNFNISAYMQYSCYNGLTTHLTIISKYERVLHHCPCPTTFLHPISSLSHN